MTKAAFQHRLRLLRAPQYCGDCVAGNLLHIWCAQLLSRQPEGARAAPVASRPPPADGLARAAPRAASDGYGAVVVLDTRPLTGTTVRFTTSPSPGTAT
jgi:hypothetical protein